MSPTTSEHPEQGEGKNGREPSAQLFGIEHRRRSPLVMKRREMMLLVAVVVFEVEVGNAAQKPPFPPAHPSLKSARSIQTSPHVQMCFIDATRHDRLPKSHHRALVISTSTATSSATTYIDPLHLAIFTSGSHQVPTPFEASLRLPTWGYAPPSILHQLVPDVRLSAASRSPSDSLGGSMSRSQLSFSREKRRSGSERTQAVPAPSACATRIPWLTSCSTTEAARPYDVSFADIDSRCRGWTTDLGVAGGTSDGVIASGSKNWTIRVWDATTAQLVAGLFGDHLSYVYRMAYSSRDNLSQTYLQTIRSVGKSGKSDTQLPCCPSTVHPSSDGKQPIRMPSLDQRQPTLQTEGTERRTHSLGSSTLDVSLRPVNIVEDGEVGDCAEEDVDILVENVIFWLIVATSPTWLAIPAATPGPGPPKAKCFGTGLKQLNDGYFYVPTSFIEATFDAFFYTKRTRTVTVFHCADGKEHDVNFGGLEFSEKPGVEKASVGVIPGEIHNSRCVWMWTPVKGRYPMLSLSINSLSSYDKCQSLHSIQSKQFRVQSTMLALCRGQAATASFPGDPFGKTFPNPGGYKGDSRI
ncbi:hypothetical protein BV22DRAFT_1173027 [Leucogyrophana mollusca]|uniref:Uncharacterized protein n=1 Tax=Leucogyrophana mollusca TaxID=85980 RepID=A0ACB8BAD6_9AGAM|nr:hypothetical protein BV22DRAFT_1173027 [Leucogyrophana mollusca]